MYKWMTTCGVLILSTVFFSSAFAIKLLPLEQDAINVFHHISPYVVNVHRLKTYRSSSWKKRTIAVGGGSGFVWNKKGYVVTNYHVVKGAKDLMVTLSNGKKVRAKLVGADRRQDIAVLKMNTNGYLKKLLSEDRISVVNSDNIQVGQVAIAIGSPFGLSQTLTEGVVSGVNRELAISSSAKGMIQTDASINPGNSGGPLLDSQGRVMGMNTLIFSKTGSSAGIGFAIPSNDISDVVRQLIKHGEIIQPGIGIVPVSDKVAAQAGIPGVVIAKVLPDTPAELRGLRGIQRNFYGQLALGDIIIGINSTRVKTVSQLYKMFNKLSVNKSIVLHVIR